MNAFAVETNATPARAASPHAEYVMPPETSARLIDAIARGDYLSVRREADAARWSAMAASFATGMEATTQLLRGAMVKSDLATPAYRTATWDRTHAGHGDRATGTTLRQRILGSLGRWLARRRPMSELASLSDNALTDIGIRREQIAGLARESYPVYLPESPVVQPPVKVVQPRIPADPARPANDDYSRHAA